MGQEGRKVGSLKRRARSHLPKMRHEIVRRCGRSTCPNKNVQNTPVLDHFWKISRRKTAIIWSPQPAQHVPEQKETRHRLQMLRKAACLYTYSYTMVSCRLPHTEVSKSSSLKRCSEARYLQGAPFRTVLNRRLPTVWHHVERFSLRDVRMSFRCHFACNLPCTDCLCNSIQEPGMCWLNL